MSKLCKILKETMVKGSHKTFLRTGNIKYIVLYFFSFICIKNLKEK